MTQPRAADDFEVIRERLEELRREREANAPKGDAASSESGEDASDEAERRRQERCEGAPPPWVPTIFLPQPTD